MDIKLDKKALKKKLAETLQDGKEKNAELLARVIIENLEMTDRGLLQLVYGFLGIEEKTLWLVGDECLVHEDALSTWNTEKDEMIKQGLFKDGFTKATIKKIDIRKTYPITIEYEGLAKKGGEYAIKISEERVKEESIKMTEKMVNPDGRIADMI